MRAVIHAALLACLAAPAYADAPCMPADKISVQLLTKFGESPIFAGLNATGNIVVLYMSAAGSWTAIQIDDDKQACIVASGQEALRLVLPGVNG